MGPEIIQVPVFKIVLFRNASKRMGSLHYSFSSRSRGCAVHEPGLKMLSGLIKGIGGEVRGNKAMHELVVGSLEQ